MAVKIKEKFAKNNPCYNGNSIPIKGAMLHSVGCPQPDPLVFHSIWNKSDANVCVHAVIGKDPVCYIMLPYTKKAWHCGSGSKGSGNNSLWSMEMTEPSTIKYISGGQWVETGNGKNTKAHVLATYQNAVEVFAYICSKFGLDPTNDNVIMSHSEGHNKGIASNHGDVEHIWNKFGLTMKQFRKDVKKFMKEGKLETVIVKVDTSSEDTSKQKIEPLKGIATVIYEGSDGLNIRKSPSITSDIYGVVYKGNKFTITGISDDEKWYQTKSGYYISAIPDYVKFKATNEQKESTNGTGYYRVRKNWGKPDTQIGAFKKLKNAKELVNNNEGYKVYDNDGFKVYPK